MPQTETLLRRECGNLTTEQMEFLLYHYDLVEQNGLWYFKDTKELALPKGAERVYPFFDEGEDLLATSEEVLREDGGKPYGRIIDGFSGGGHSLLPQLRRGIAKSGFGIDLNPRAINLAQINAQMNGFTGRAIFCEGDVRRLADAVLEHDPRMRDLLIANPPFALTDKGTWALDGIKEEERLMRDGGPDGLTLTRTYITQSLARAYVESAVEFAHPGDTIIGVAYSRIRPDGGVELDDLLRTLAADRGTYTLSLIGNRTLWRGPDGQKKQPNPMPLTRMRIKGTTEAQMQAYDEAAANHMREGYSHLGYFRYVIRVGKTGPMRRDFRVRTDSLLRD